MNPFVKREKWVQCFDYLFKGALYGEIDVKSSDCYMVAPTELLNEYRNGWIVYGKGCVRSTGANDTLAGESDETGDDVDDGLVDDDGHAFRTSFCSCVENELQTCMTLMAHKVSTNIHGARSLCMDTCSLSDVEMFLDQRIK